MPAGIGHRQLIVGVQLFRRIYRHELRLAMFRQDSAAVVIQHEFGINQFAIVLQQPVDAIRCAAFLVRSQRQNDVAVRT